MATSPYSPESSVIELADVHLTLETRAGPVPILKEIELEIAAGETVSVVGPSGSGKTTMMLIIAGLERVSRGRVRLLDHDLERLDEDERARVRRDHVGILFQDFHLIPTMTALENVAVPLELARANNSRNRAEAQLSDVGLAHRTEHYPLQLSGGEQQRVALARALITEPALLLADEPTGNLDSATGTQVIDLVFSLAHRQETTLVLITHDRSVAERCSRLVELHDGRITHDSFR